MPYFHNITSFKALNLMSADFLNALHQAQNQWVRGISSDKIIAWFEDLFDILFPVSVLDKAKIELLCGQNRLALQGLISEYCLVCKDFAHIKTMVATFYDELPKVYEQLQQDATATLQHDPAAESLQEILNSYPGFYAITAYRVAHVLAKLGLPLIPRVLTEYAHRQTGIDIHPGATIDSPFVIDHGTGIVIGETTQIGKFVHIYQGVTLGALWVEKSLENTKRHPTVEDHVIIYANATILGGNTIIGNHSIIGGNTFITKSVDPYTLVHQSNKSIHLDRKNLEDVDLFMI